MWGLSHHATISIHSDARRTVQKQPSLNRWYADLRHCPPSYHPHRSAHHLCRRWRLPRHCPTLVRRWRQPHLDLHLYRYLQAHVLGRSYQSSTCVDAGVLVNLRLPVPHCCHQILGCIEGA